MAKKKITEAKAKAAAEKYLEAEKLYKIAVAEQKAAMTAAQNEYTGVIKEHGTTMDEQQLILETYCEQNREDLLQDGKKSCDFFGLKLGYKKGRAGLKLLDNWDWDAVILKAKKLLPDFIVTKTELNKAEVLRKYSNIGEKTLHKIGVKVEQKESFYIK